MGVRRAKLLVYIVTASPCGVVGLLHDAYLMAVDPNVGEMWMLNVIATIVAGEASLFGGRGSPVGTLLIDALIICVLNSSLNLLHGEHSEQKVVARLVTLRTAPLDAGQADHGRRGRHRYHHGWLGVGASRTPTDDRPSASPRMKRRRSAMELMTR